ncbi:MAG: U32 family peptidase [Clostridiales bacterium]|nr:U32 family peptidase [Clostridiales bacterium]MCF8021125.1 U32 family peptidase [Clostridiales bacterium]
MKKPELLAPAGDMEKLEVAVAYGADAVYLGGTSFGLRAAAATFDENELVRAVGFAHWYGVKVYVTVNIFAHNKDIQELQSYLKYLEKIEVDGVIISDPGVIELARETVPRLPVHLSTQANTTNWKSARFWEKQGVKRIILARELSLKEIKEIKENVNLPLEMFVHGAMCISYSGRCLLSNYMTGRDSNMGDCSQACRWKYALVEEKRPGEYYPIEEDRRGTYILSSRDLCLLHQLPRLIDAGVDSFKIEGRVKSIHYVAAVTRVYRKAIDACINDPEGYSMQEEWANEIGKVSNREYISGFIDGPPDKDGFTPVKGIYNRPYTFVGVARNVDKQNGWIEIEQRNHFSRGEELEVMPPRGDIFSIKVDEMYDIEGNPIEKAPHPRMTVYLAGMPFVEPHTMLRRKEK